METIDEEEMKEQLAEEMAKYEEEGYFKRLGKMFAGLGRPHASREYKEAVIELQRQIAPLLAILVPLVGAAILFVVTAMGDSSEQKVKVEIAQVEKEEQLDEPEQPPEQPAKRKRSRRSRGKKSGDAEKAAQPKPASEKEPAEKPEQPEKSEKPAGSKRSHRGGRRHRSGNKNASEQPKEQQPKPYTGSEISPQQAQQILQAIQAKEKETQDKVNKEKADVLQSRQKDKNW